MITEDKDALLQVAADRPGDSGPNGPLRDRLRGVRQAWRQVFGVPDYDGYLAHMAAHHAGEPVLSRREFFARAIERKYGKSGPRCC